MSFLADSVSKTAWNTSSTVNALSVCLNNRSIAFWSAMSVKHCFISLQIIINWLKKFSLQSNTTFNLLMFLSYTVQNTSGIINTASNMFLNVSLSTSLLSVAVQTEYKFIHNKLKHTLSKHQTYKEQHCYTWFEYTQQQAVI